MTRRRSRRPLAASVAGPAPGIPASLLAAALALAAVLPLGGCGPGQAPSTKPVVIVSVLPQAYFVQRVAGDLVDVEVMIPPGANEALHEPTMAQMRAMSRAAVYVKVGHPNFPFERAWLDKLIAEKPGILVVDASEGIVRKAGDPHVWVSPGCVRTMTRNIHDALVKILPEHVAGLDAGRDAFLADIDEIDREIRTALGDRRGRSFFVFHPAWGYLADEYGLEQVAIEHGEKEPSPEELGRLIDRARSEGVKIILVQPQFPKRSAELVASEIGGRVVAVDPLARDWLDGMRKVTAALVEAFSS